MIAKMTLTPQAAAFLAASAGMDSAEVSGGELEFRHVPYFLVARSREKWAPEVQGDIDSVRVLNVSPLGLVVAPDGGTLGGNPAQAQRHTVVPWSNVISYTLNRGGSPTA